MFWRVVRCPLPPANSSATRPIWRIRVGSQQTAGNLGPDHMRSSGLALAPYTPLRRRCGRNSSSVILPAVFKAARDRNSSMSSHERLYRTLVPRVVVQSTHRRSTPGLLLYRDYAYLRSSEAMTAVSPSATSEFHGYDMPSPPLRPAHCRNGPLPAFGLKHQEPRQYRRSGEPFGNFLRRSGGTAAVNRPGFPSMPW